MLENLTPPVKNKGSCKVATVVASMSEADRTILLNAVDDTESWPVKTLSKELSSLGVLISDSPIYNHRSKSCACYR
jgi:hypothetical protein